MQLKKLFVSLFVSFFLCFFSENLYSIEKYQYFLEKAEKLSLWDDPVWKKILFYQKHYFARESSLVSRSQFFIHPNGDSDAKQELIATLKKFFSAEDSTYKCKFPRRLDWLKEKLDDSQYNISKINCPQLESWLLDVYPKEISIVFSSFYMNNPASMFGHTFLRFHNSKSALTDYGLNFSAQVDLENESAFAYIFKGLLGLYPGKFILLPYSLKVQEYNNSESRDLWEYPLNLNDNQIKNLLLSLWEVIDYEIAYRYVDKNCSYILLALIDNADDLFNFSSKFKLWTNPPDTVKALWNERQLSKTFSYRPSSWRRFVQRYHILTNEEKTFSDFLKSEKLPDNLQKLYWVMSSARTLDALSEFIDYKERLVGNQNPQNYSLFRDQILKERASLQIASETIENLSVQSEAPHKGLAGSKFSLGFAYDEILKEQLLFELRPILHALDEASAGYSKESEIQVLQTSLRYDLKQKEAVLNKLTVLKLVSVPSVLLPPYPLSWNLQLGMLQDWDCEILYRTENCLRSFLAGGAGYSLNFDKIQIYSLLQTEIAYQNKFFLQTGMGILSAILIRPTDSLVISSLLDFMQRYSLKNDEFISHLIAENSVSFLLNSEVEQKIFFTYNFKYPDWKLGFSFSYHFF